MFFIRRLPSMFRPRQNHSSVSSCSVILFADISAIAWFNPTEFLELAERYYVSS
jgi:hypothetical protein